MMHPASRRMVEDLASLDLGYAPPFAPVWDPILVAARQAAAAVRRAGDAGDDVPFLRAANQAPVTGGGPETEKRGERDRWWQAGRKSQAKSACA
jgi:hypothetical protein